MVGAESHSLIILLPHKEDTMQRLVKFCYKCDASTGHTRQDNNFIVCKKCGSVRFYPKGGRRFSAMELEMLFSFLKGGRNA
jgi:Zn finger protein HypA/HybF involved in hydrogenase expression